MVNRMQGGARSKRWEPEPLAWYCEHPSAVRQLMDGIDFGDDVIFDPCCGRGNILDVAQERGHMRIGSDIVDRGVKASHGFILRDVFDIDKPPTHAKKRTSVICNPPYGYEEDIAERVIRHVLTWPVRRAAFLLPIAFQAAACRWRFFTHDFRPSHCAILSQRQTMPPGSKIAEIGSKAFKGGMADYLWIVWTYPHRCRTETIWLRPDNLE